MTSYVVLQEFNPAGDRASTWDDLGEFEGRTPKEAVVAAVAAMSPDDQAEAKQTRFRVAAASSFTELAPPTVETRTTVVFA